MSIVSAKRSFIFDIFYLCIFIHFFFVIFYSVWSLCIIENKIWWNNFGSLKILKVLMLKKVKIKCARSEWDEYWPFFFFFLSMFCLHISMIYFSKSSFDKQRWGVIFLKRQSSADPRNSCQWKYIEISRDLALILMVI